MTTETLVVNLIGVSRRESRNGREFIVAPVSMIVPGVLNGNQGPILYTREENAKSVSLWNGVPITPGHPTDDSGKPISAQSPQIKELGRIFNTSSNGKLTAEAWFDVKNTQKIAPSIFNSLVSNRPIELSTGLGLDLEEAPEGSITNTGEEYKAIARNYRPDHLAILTDEKGACSLEDGCGVLVNSDGLVINGSMSHEQMRAELQNLLGKEMTQDQPMAFIEEVFDNFFVFRSGEELRRQSFNIRDGKPKLKGDPERVMRKTEFVPVDEDDKKTKPTNNTINGGRTMSTDTKLDDTQRKTIVDALINNCDCWDENDRKTLNEFNDEKLQGWEVRMKKEQDRAAVENAAKQGAKGLEPVVNKEEKTETPTINTDQIKTALKGLTEEDWLQMAPESVRNQLNFAQEVIDQKKSGLVDRLIVANSELSDDDKGKVRNFLMGKDIKELEMLTGLLPKKEQESESTVPTLNFLGSSSVAEPTASKPTEQLIAPEIDWSAAS